MRLLKSLVISVLAAAAALASVGCETLEKSPNTASLVVQYATAKVIEAGKTADERSARAVRIKSIATEAKTWFDGDDVTVGLLQAAAQARLAKLNLGPADLLLANGLVGVVVEELQKKVGEGVLSPEQKMTVSQVLAWIVGAADLYAENRRIDAPPTRWAMAR
jgi:hypothetical protein